MSRRRGLRVAVVHNARYREGNGLSVLAAKDIVGDAPFVLVMADHVFASALLRRLRARSSSLWTARSDGPPVSTRPTL